MDEHYDMSAGVRSDEPKGPGLRGQHAADSQAMSWRTAAKTLILTLLGFKLFAATVIVLTEPSPDAVLMVVFFNWPWIAAGIALAALPLIVWYRLLRVRARRAQLLRQEWRT